MVIISGNLYICTYHNYVESSVVKGRKWRIFTKRERGGGERRRTDRLRLDKADNEENGSSVGL